MNPEILLQLIHDLTERALTAERVAMSLDRKVKALESERDALRAKQTTVTPSEPSSSAPSEAPQAVADAA